MRIFIGIVLITLSTNSQGFFGRSAFGNANIHFDADAIIGDLRSDLLNVVEEKWIEQKVDNFNRQNQQTWLMRYFESLEFYQVAGPIFIYVGGEWEISKGRLLVGHMFDMAREFNASLFYTEHRYYGKSRPTENTTTENLKFLTVDQTIADLAHFVASIKKTIPGLSNSKVFLIGGSYAGTLATWFRLKYPHLVNAVWASSAPLLAKLDFSEFNEVLSKSLETIAGQECFSIFKSAFGAMEVIADSGNFSRIERSFRLCQPLEAPDDIPHFFYEIADHIAAFVQGYTPNRIEAACKFLQNPEFPDSVVALGVWVNGLSKDCLEMSYKKSVQKYSDVSWGSEGNKQMRQWIYQSCSELGWFETTSSKGQIFGSKVPKEYFIKLCSDLYDGIFNATNMEQNIFRTNLLYGGLRPRLSNVYFTHGNLDPWRPAGIEKDLHSNAPATIVPLVSHVADFASISNNDTVHLKASKQRIRNLILKWLDLKIVSN